MGLFSSGTSNSPVLNWEALKNNGGLGSSKYTYRTKVLGGWLISSFVSEGMGLTFIPDPKHEWDGNSL
ncbi:hypothetical protein RJP56_18790 [Shewanella baltica]|uniref:hypothetical protein n=1 Tax=Shewanella baltica TaxID=62322 RepID=UPI002871DEE2|nr:hypothetical protein [Shewanella baltica]MDR9768112.1 hypothetical protein [Shewanella baltica]